MQKPVLFLHIIYRAYTFYCNYHYYYLLLHQYYYCLLDGQMS